VLGGEKRPTVLGVKKHSIVLGVKSTPSCSVWKALYRAQREEHPTVLDGRSTLPCSVRKALYRAFREKHPTVIGGGALRPVFRRTFVPFTLKGPVDQRAQPDAPARGGRSTASTGRRRGAPGRGRLSAGDWSLEARQVPGPAIWRQDARRARKV